MPKVERQNLGKSYPAMSNKRILRPKFSVASAAIRILALEDKTRSQGKLRNKATNSCLLFGGANSSTAQPDSEIVLILPANCCKPAELLTAENRCCKRKN